MLRHLTIRNFILIDECQLDFDSGLCVFTGETGAGKSILLGALGLALGERLGGQPLRQPDKQGLIAATFDETPEMRQALEENGILCEDEGITIKRVLLPGGKNRTLINDQPAGLTILKEIGDALVEIHGQHGQRALTDHALQQAMLDQYAKLAVDAKATAAAYQHWQEVVRRIAQLQADLEQARRDEDYLQHMQRELAALNPQVGEEGELAAERALLTQSEKLGAVLQEALVELTGSRPVESALSNAQKLLIRSDRSSDEALVQVVDGLERVQVELGEVLQRLEELSERFGYDPKRQDEVEERLFALRGAARKHQVPADELATVLADITAKLANLHSQESISVELKKEAAARRTAYLAQAKKLSATRSTAAEQLAQQVMAELQPLKMTQTRFRVNVERLEEANWRASGIDRVYFEVSTNPGNPFGPLHKIASGGELSRFMLALKVVLARDKSGTTLIFDEIDTGTSGAVADAIGQRLAQLGTTQQVMVITHLPQVASKGAQHFRVAKEQGSDSTRTQVMELDAADRREELAKMLSGSVVTDEARRAANRLMETA